MVFLFCRCCIEFSNGKAGIFDELLYTVVQYAASTIVSTFYYSSVLTNLLKEKAGNTNDLDRVSTEPVSWTTENLCNLNSIKSEKLKGSFKGRDLYSVTNN